MDQAARSSQPCYGTISNISSEQKNSPSSSWGLIWAGLSGILLCLGSGVVKHLSYISATEIAFLRFVGSCVFSLPVVIYLKHNPFNLKGVCGWMILLGLLLAPTIILLFSSIDKIPVAEAMVIHFTSPIFTAILGRIFLKEPFGVVHGFSLFLMVLGIVLITRMPTAIYQLIRHGELERYLTNHTLGYMEAISSGLLMSIIYIICRKLKTVNTNVNILDASVLSTLIATVVLWVNSESIVLPRCGWDGVLIVGMTITNYLGILCMLQAFIFQNAGPVSNVRAAVDIIGIYIIQAFAFHVIPDAYSIFGSIFICIAIFVLGISSDSLNTLLRKMKVLK